MWAARQKKKLNATMATHFVTLKRAIFFPVRAVKLKNSRKTKELVQFCS